MRKSDPSPAAAPALAVPHLVILAGGQGTRLAGVMGDVPKVLAPVGGKPVLQHQLELAAAAGVEQVTIFAGHLAPHIERFVGDGARFGLGVRVLVEAQPLGSAGALVAALDQLPEQFLVLYGDVMAAVDLAAIARRHLDQHASLTALAHPNDHPHDSDLLETDVDGWVTAIHPYPHPAGRDFANLVNAALYVIRRDALRPFMGRGKLDFTKDVIAPLVTGGGRVLVHRSVDYIKDMGTPARLERVEADWQAGRISLADAARRRPAVFLDRDGTLNVERGFLRTAEGLELIPGAGMALRSLRQAGFRLVVITNQPVIARGEASEAEVAAIHRRLEWELGKEGAYLDGIYLCPHHPDGGFAGERPELKIACDCRKPGTALFERACRELFIDPEGSWMVGDQTRDLELARRAGLRSILVRTGAGGGDGQYPAAPDFTADDIAAAAALILAQQAVAA
ncbi:MAG: HAD-IIIA family hydrolase [Phenylobacterium sp.]